MYATTEGNCQISPFGILEKAEVNNVNRVAIGHLSPENVHSISTIRNNFNMLSSMIKLLGNKTWFFFSTNEICY